MINVLDTKFAQGLSQLLKNCEKQYIVMIPYEKLRSPQLQAQYWAQGRTLNEVQNQINKLKETEAFYLAKCLENAEIKKGKIITNALPGCSWHQWGEAVDCYWERNGKANWDVHIKDENNQNGYEVYAMEAKKLGLEAGFYWKEFVDGVHVQLQSYSSPLEIYSISEINEIMRKFYG